MTATGTRHFALLFSALRSLGYVEGVNLEVERFSANGQTEDFSGIARAIVGSNPDLIHATGARLFLALKSATRTIPIVGSLADPVAFGVIADLAHPGGNITGVGTDAGIAIQGKRLELLRELVPTATKIGYLASSRVRDNAMGHSIRAYAAHRSIDLLAISPEWPVSERSFVEPFDRLAAQGAQALLVEDQSENTTFSETIVKLANQARIPALYPSRNYVDHGGLMAYFVNSADLYPRIAAQIDSILKGADPGSIPFYLATRYQLVINLKAAQTLGIEVSPGLLARADAVIE